MFKFAKKIVLDESGATAIEYGLIAALVSVAAIGALSVLCGSLDTTFTTVSGELDNANGSITSLSTSGDSESETETATE